MLNTDPRRLKLVGLRPAPTTAPPTDRAVSPVIGVILMVAVTVILASTIGAFVLNQTPGETTPEVKFRLANPPGPNVTLTHSGGEAVNSTRVYVLVDGAAPATTGFSATVLTAGTTVEFPASSEQTVLVVYRLEGDDTAVLARYEVP